VKFRMSEVLGRVFIDNLEQGEIFAKLSQRPSHGLFQCGSSNGEPQSGYIRSGHLGAGSL
jgi:hypothetical protein